MAVDYSDILGKLEKQPPRQLNDHILLLDGMNTIIRSFALIKSINPDGNHVGGMVGFLRSLSYVNRIIDPTRIVVVWDGRGGSGNRQNLNPNYKAQRANSRITHWGLFDSKQEETDSLSDQIQRTQEYLRTLPVHQIQMEKLEADDIIAYLAKRASKAGKKVTIVSSDKDFLQLIDDNIQVYAPIKKKVINRSNVVDEIQVLPENYNILKALLGDKSDNLPGVKGLGIKTVLSEWKSFTYDPNASLQDVLDLCETRLGEKKIYAKIIHEFDKVLTNYKLMDLHDTALSEREIKQVEEQLQQPIPDIQTGIFLHLLQQDKVEGITKSTESWLQGFTNLKLS